MVCRAGGEQQRGAGALPPASPSQGARQQSTVRRPACCGPGFVRACPKGHVDDLDWWRFAHGAADTCRQQLWLDERGMSGDLADLVVRCECGKSRSLYEATQLEMNPLGTCRGARPWLGRSADEDCKLPSRLLIRTAGRCRLASDHRTGHCPGSKTRPCVVRARGPRLARSGHQTCVRRVARLCRALDLGEHLRVLRRSQGVRGSGSTYGVETRPPCHAAPEHPAPEERHHRFGTTGAQVRRSFLEDRLTRIVAFKRAL